MNKKLRNCLIIVIFYGIAWAVFISYGARNMWPIEFDHNRIDMVVISNNIDNEDNVLDQIMKDMHESGILEKYQGVEISGLSLIKNNNVFQNAIAFALLLAKTHIAAIAFIISLVWVNNWRIK